MSNPALRGDMKGDAMLWITVMVIHTNAPPVEWVDGFDLPSGMDKEAARQWARNEFNIPLHRIVTRAEVY